MSLLQRRIDFATKYIVAASGAKFDISSRPWVREQFWLPADGYKWWPIDRENCCESCFSRANTIVEWTWDNPTLDPSHSETPCAGLKLCPIIITILALPRREGKTFNTAAYNLSTIFQSKNKSILFIASAKTQTDKLIRDNYLAAIRQNEKLAEACDYSSFHGTLKVPQNKSLLEITASTHGSITGTGRTHVIIDEARDVKGRVLMAAIPSIEDAAGYECPRGHVRIDNPTPDILRRQAPCSVCGADLIPWQGRLIIMSSSGLDLGDAWFNELVEQIDTRPDANTHLYRQSESQNPKVSKDTVNALDRVFSGVSGLRDYVEVELHNKAARPGDSYLTKAEIEACISQRDNAEGSMRRCLAFLDTSLSTDLTSLVIGEEREGCKIAFDRIDIVRIDVWDPAKQPGKVIDPLAITAHLDDIMPRFPGLLWLDVDVRIMPWAVQAVNLWRTTKPWGKRVRGFSGNRAERDIAWESLEMRVLARTITFPRHERMLRELAGLRRHRTPQGRMEIRDAAREKSHADISESIATVCYMAHQEAIISRQSLVQVKEINKSSLISRLTKSNVRGLSESSF